MPMHSVPCLHPHPPHVWPVPFVHSCVLSSTPCLLPRPCLMHPHTFIHSCACLHMAFHPSVLIYTTPNPSSMQCVACTIGPQLHALIYTSPASRPHLHAPSHFFPQLCRPTPLPVTLSTHPH